MKLIECIVRPSRLEAVKDSLTKEGISGLTVTDVQGAGRQRGHKEIYRGHEYNVDLVRKVKLEIAVPSEKVDFVVDLVTSAARSGDEGQIGDGKIFVLSLDDVVRIRTGERGESAI